MFGAWGLISRNTGNGTTFYAFDERGNVAQRTSSNGTVTSTDMYDAYGNQRSGASDVWGFGGQAGYYTDGETGLVLCTHRFYDPQQGRFLTRDPMGYGGGINLYSYTQNNPVNWMDPDGTDTTDNTMMVTLTAIGAWGGGTIGAGGGGILGMGVGAIPGAMVGAGLGGAAGAASGLVAVGLRHALLNMMSGGGGFSGGTESGPSSSGGPYSHLQDPLMWGQEKTLSHSKRKLFIRRICGEMGASSEMTKLVKRYNVSGRTRGGRSCRVTQPRSTTSSRKILLIPA